MASNSGRNQAAFRLVCRVGRWTHHGILPRDRLTADVLDACERNGLVREDGRRAVLATIASGLAKSAADALPDLGGSQWMNRTSTAPAAIGLRSCLAATRSLKSGHGLSTIALPTLEGCIPLSADQLLTRKFEPPEHVLAPWLQTQGLAMIHAPRGIGKTHVSIGVACAVAAGTSFLKWSAPKPRRVLFIDGEMPGAMLQERFARTIDALKADMPPDGFKLVAADLEPDGLPDLASEEGQQFYAEVIAPADLVIVDNLSTICRTLRENEADSWGPVQAWALRLRREGKSVLFIHHAGKSGGQRGTSKKEDILNTVIALRRPPDYEASQGARFEVHYEKARGFYGDDAEPFEAWLKDGQWQTADVTLGRRRCLSARSEETGSI